MATSELRQSDPARGTLDNGVPTIAAERLAAGDAAAVAAVRRACRHPGFFFLDADFDNAGATDAVLRQMQAFFALDDHDPRKQAVKVAGSQSGRGWTPLYGELPYQPGTIAHLESFDCGRRRSAADAEATNVWPPLPGFRRDVRACWNTFNAAGMAVLRGLALAAGLEPGFFASRCDSQELNTLRLLHYPRNDSLPTDADVGIAAHTDFECITLIMQTAPGLELLATDGCWYDVPGHDGRLVVMLDDMLERWTNGVFRATGHRVRRTADERYSVVKFFAVNDDEIIAPLPPFVSDTRPANYPPVAQRSHLASELKRAAANRDRSD